METILSKTYTAAADYSTTGQYRFVYLSSANTVTLSGASGAVLGILQNNPAAGEDANVMLMGISRLSMSAAVAVMARLESAANGQGVTTTTDTDNVAAIVLEAADNANEQVKVLLTPGCMYAG